MAENIIQCYLNNDVFHPIFVGVDQYHFSIFNRWGELIFESTDPNIGWDGYYRNELCKHDDMYESERKIY
jgi:gliding motility-associated-like protein